MQRNKNIQLNLIYILTLLSLILTASSCGKKSKSEGAEFEVLPTTPIVIIGDTVSGSGTKVPGPWFNFRLKISNKTDEPITITALALKIYAEDDTGKKITSNANFSPADFDFETGGTTSVKCTFGNFGTFAAGETDTSFYLYNSNPACTAIPLFLVGNGQKGANGKNFRYTVEVTPVGWFGTYDSPKDRFDTKFNFYTQ